MRPTEDKEKEQERKQLQCDVEQFLKNGGKIKRIPRGVMKDVPKKATPYNLDIVATRIHKGEKIEDIALEHNATLTTMRAGLKSHGYT